MLIQYQCLKGTESYMCCNYINEKKINSALKNIEGNESNSDCVWVAGLCMVFLFSTF